MVKLATGASYHAVTDRIVKGSKIPLPSLSEQERIAAILDKADAIRCKRLQAEEMAGKFLQSVYIDMFGDPITNQYNWEESTLRKCIDSIEGGWSANSDSRRAEADELGVLKVSAVTSGFFRRDENKVVVDDVSSKKLIFPMKGDLLFSRANTRDLVAATCLVEHDNENVFLPDKLWRITPNRCMVTSEYLKFLLTNNEFRTRLTKRATGTSGSMLNISKAKLLDTTFPKPPINMQKNFSDLYWSERATSNRRAQASSCAESIYLSLAKFFYVYEV